MHGDSSSSLVTFVTATLLLSACSDGKQPHDARQESGGSAAATAGAGTTGGTSAGSGGRNAGGAGVAGTPGSAGTSVAGSGGTSGSGGGGSDCAPGEIGTPPQCVPAPPLPPGPGRRWTLTFDEEFDGSDYDHEKLSACFDWNYGACTSSFNKGREHYDPGQIAVSDGTAKLIAEPLMPPLSSTACFEDECTYRSGLLSTCRPDAGNGSDYLYAFTYGYVEARMKFPATQGFFTAFWMLPADPNYAYRSEIDIVEILGDDPTTIFMTYHYDDRSRSHAVNQGKFNNGDCPVRDYGDDFHTFGMDWQPDHVAWYIDGTKCDEFTGDETEIENGPMQLIVDLMVDHSWQQDWDVTLEDTTLTRELEVDYLRVYQLVP